MLSHLHEILLLLFRNQPALAAQLLREVLHTEVPDFTAVVPASGELTEIAPTEYRADVVLLLHDEHRKPVQGIIVEVQRAMKERKRYTWPVYATTLRARLGCPVALLVVTVEEAVARWAATPIELGGGNIYTPLVLGPSAVPEITDETQARAYPELAVLSVVAHGRDPDVAKAVQIALAAQQAAATLDTEHRNLYVDFLYLSLSAEAQQRLENMLQMGKFEYQSELAKRFIAEGRKEGRKQGREEGEAKGRAEGERAALSALILKLLTARFGVLPKSAQQRISKASIKKLDAIGERLLTAKTLREALG